MPTDTYYTVKQSSLTAVADAIREKSGGSQSLSFPNGFVSEIGNIGSGSAITTAFVSATYASDILYYTDANMTVQSGLEIVNQQLPIGSLVFICNTGPTPYQSSYIGLTKVVGYGSVIQGEYLVYEVTG